jgi:hypothetical protein
VIAADRVTGIWFGCGVSPAQIVPTGTPALLQSGG